VPPPTQAGAAGADDEASEPSTDEAQEEQTSGSAEREEPDLSALPIGTGNFSNGPQAGYIWSCQTQFGDAGGAKATGDWYNESTGLWNLNLKPLVDGSVDWDSTISITVQGNTRIIEANGLPASPTGIYPISSSDDAYQFDSNPNSISSQSYRLELPANPTKNAQAQCVGGEVGISIDGVVINNALDALGRDAVAFELQDACDGHPHTGGIYHYHGYSPCLEDQDALGQSALIGYALDGFEIYGPYDENGQVLFSADLDECHGRTSVVEWDGEMVEMYHYVATFDFPYTVGCYWGDPVVFTDAQTGGGSGGQGPGGQGGGDGN
jgi:hypothetical protein